MITMKRAQELEISVVDNEIVRRYIEDIRNGCQIRPIALKNDGKRIKDGNHRAAAYKLLGMDIPTIPAT